MRTTINNAEPVPATKNEGNPALPPAKNQKLFTVGRRCGRLANRLILFANFIALAEEQGHRLINFTFHSYAGLFEATRRNIYCRYPAPKRRSWMDVVPGVAPLIQKTRVFYHLTRAACVLNQRFPIFGSAAVTLLEPDGCQTLFLDSPEFQERIRPAKIVFVYGWRFRAPDLVRKHGDKIREYFRPIAEYEQASRQAVERLRQKADIVVGVHVRLGDNWKWRGGKYYFPVSQHGVWMRELAGRFPGRKVSFLICSDEPRNEAEFPGLSVGLGPGSAVGDLYALAQCDYIMGPPSTYTQWASFYGEKPLLQFGNSNDPAPLEKFRVSYLECLDWD
jgi:hypothetical protein